jgi:hypothetical protein
MVVRWVMTSAGHSVLTSVDLMDMTWADEWALVSAVRKVDVREK